MQNLLKTHAHDLGRIDSGALTTKKLVVRWVEEAAALSGLMSLGGDSELPDLRKPPTFRKNKPPHAERGRTKRRSSRLWCRQSQKHDA